MVVAVATKTKAAAKSPAKKSTRTAKKTVEREASQTKAGEPSVGALLTPTVELADGKSSVVIYDENGKATKLEVPPDHLRNLAKECTRACSILGV